MCQLLGMNCNTPTDIMFSFTGFATRAEEHKDGFGVAFFEGRGVRCFVDHQSARHSPVAQMIKGYPIKSDNVIAHIRKATQGRVSLREHAPVRARAVGPLLGVRAQRRPEGFLSAAARRVPSGRRNRQRERVLLAAAGIGESARERAERGGADDHAAPSSCRSWPRAALSTSCSATVRRCGRIARRSCTTSCASIRFGSAALQDEDLSVDFAAVTTPRDRVAVVVTEPLTRDETWIAIAPGTLRVFVGGAPLVA